MTHLHGTIRSLCGAAYPVMCALAMLVFHMRLGAQDLGQIGSKRPFGLNGSIALQGGPYFYSGDGEPRNQPFFWNSIGTLNLSVYGWQVPFSYSVGSQERSWTQPFNRYGASPYYKWIRLHAGYRSMRFSPYTFAGLQFLGGGVELEPKGFRFSAFYGRFNKPIAQDTLGTIVPIPAYRRMGAGVKIGVGNRRSYLDLMLVRTEDDTTSIPEVANGTRVTPMENLVLGLSGRVALGPKLTWELDLGASAINEDIRAPRVDPSDLPRFADGLFVQRYGSKALLAGHTALRWNARRFTMRVQYKEVEPGYRSLAAFYQQTDLRAITVEPGFRLAKGKLRVAGSYGVQQDNIRNTKGVGSLRRIGSATVTWNPSQKYGLDASFSNYGIAQQTGLQVLNDTFRVAQNNRNISLSQRLMFSNKVRTWNLMLAAGHQQLQDLNPFGTYATTENEVLYANLFVSRVRMHDNLMVNGGLNMNNNATASGRFLLIGPSLGCSRPFMQQKLTLSLNASFNKAFMDGQDAGSTLNASHLMSYRMGKSHRLQLSITALLNKTTFVASREFTEVRFMGGYVFTFRSKT